MYLPEHNHKIHINTTYTFDWFWLRLHLRINWSSIKFEFERDVDVLIYDKENWYEHFKWILYVFLIYLYTSYQHVNYFLLFFLCRFVLLGSSYIRDVLLIFKYQCSFLFWSCNVLIGYLTDVYRLFLIYEYYMYFLYIYILTTNM